MCKLALAFFDGEAKTELGRAFIKLLQGVEGELLRTK
jgi:hypothetical protein